jgi:hypothetical protein
MQNSSAHIKRVTSRRTPDTYLAWAVARSGYEGNDLAQARAITLATLDYHGGTGSTAKLVLSVLLQQLIVERLY